MSERLNVKTGDWIVPQQCLVFGTHRCLQPDSGQALKHQLLSFIIFRGFVSHFKAQQKEKIELQWWVNQQKMNLQEEKWGKKMLSSFLNVNIFWFLLVIYDSKLNIFGLWVVCCDKTRYLKMSPWTLRNSDQFLTIFWQLID